MTRSLPRASLVGLCDAERSTDRGIASPILWRLKAFAHIDRTLFGLGDCIAQKGVEKTERYDVARTARLAGYGGLIFAPLVTRELQLLSRIQFSSKAATIATRVGADQLLFTPAVCVYTLCCDADRAASPCSSRP